MKWFNSNNWKWLRYVGFVMLCLISVFKTMAQLPTQPYQNKDKLAKTVSFDSRAVTINVERQLLKYKFVNMIIC